MDRTFAYKAAGPYGGMGILLSLGLATFLFAPGTAAGASPKAGCDGPSLWVNIPKSAGKPFWECTWKLVKEVSYCEYRSEEFMRRGIGFFSGQAVKEGRQVRCEFCNIYVKYSFLDRPSCFVTVNRKRNEIPR